MKKPLTVNIVSAAGTLGQPISVGTIRVPKVPRIDTGEAFETEEIITEGVGVNVHSGELSKQAFVLDLFKGGASKVTKVKIEDMTSDLNSALTALDASFSPWFNKPVGGLNLQTVEVNLQASADGKIGILGTGASLGGSASIKLVFERKKADSNLTQ
ncbi:MAG TPA: hypothetical protein VN934_06065 [Candidatus Tumulicola sp.]|nr:hypothetical protein [Candidatus Tumulicola sp.]